MKKMKTTALMTLALALGCAPGPDEHDEPSANDEACEHASEGPFLDVTAAGEGEDAPDVSAEHSAYNVETVPLDEDGNRGGRVSFASSEAGDYNLYLSLHANVTVTDSDGTEVALEDSVHEVAECDEVAMFHTVELGVGTYEIALGPTDAETLVLVVEEATHAEQDEDHDEEH